MEFKDILNALFDELSFSNAQVSRAAGLDPSLLSRFRCGIRLPSRSSEQLTRLCNGIISAAENEGKRDALIKFFNLEENLSEDELCSSIYNSLCGESVPLKPRRNKPKYSSNTATVLHRGWVVDGFAEKLNKLMRLFSFSNIKLSRALGVDTSLISRLRTGARAPSSESRFLSDAAHYFALCAKNCQQTLALCEISGIPYLEDLSENDLTQKLHRWFLGKPHEDESGIIDVFLSALGSISSKDELSPMPFATAPLPEGIHSHCEHFFGIDGLRQASLRILAETAARNQPCTLLQFSDQNLDWLFESEKYKTLWSKMMLSVFYRGHKVRVIHSLDRTASEIFSAIEMWLPFYISGMVEPYCLNRSSDSGFVHTLFAAPGVASVSSSIVRGSESCAEYTYSNDPADIHYISQQFDALLESCSPMMQVFTENNAAQMYHKMLDIESHPGCIRTLSSAPYIATMSPEQLLSILKRERLPQAKINEVMRFRESRCRVMENAVSTSGMYEYISLPSNSELESGSVYLNLPMLLSSPLAYTPKDYSAHLRSTAKALEQFPSYHFTPLALSPLEHIRLYAKSDDCCMIFKMDKPCTAFLFQHPVIVSSFSDYLDSLARRRSSLATERDDVISFLYSQ